TLLNWENNRKKQANYMLYVIGLLAVIFFVVFFIQNHLSYAIFGGALSIIVFMQIYNVRNASRRIKDVSEQFAKSMKAMTMNQTTDETLRKQQQLANELSANEQLMQTLQIEQLQWEEKNNHFALKEHKWVSAVEQEREKFPLLKQIELQYWTELLH